MCVYVGTNVKIVDKTGAREVLIICLFKNKKKAQVAQTLKSVCKKAIVKTSSGKRLAQKGNMYNIVLVKQLKPIKKISGTQVFFKTKGAVLLNREDGPLSYRLVGPVSINLRYKYSKIMSYSDYII